MNPNKPAAIQVFAAMTMLEHAARHLEKQTLWEDDDLRVKNIRDAAVELNQLKHRVQIDYLMQSGLASIMAMPEKADFMNNSTITPPRKVDKPN